MRTLSATLLIPLLAACAPTQMGNPDTVEYRMVFETSDGGRPTLVNARRDLPHASVRGGYQWVAEIEWVRPEVSAVRAPKDFKLPKEVSDLTERIQREVVARRMALPAAAIRTDNRRHRWMYYTAGREAAEQIGAIVRSVAGPAATVTIREDPEWTAFRQFLSTVPASYKAQ